ncbi:MAG TPA: Hsp70 family protein [Streptosporangiaceae bacterium]|nr:Hsp70 family protein [Streptosporangiaceae bacterium]
MAEPILVVDFGTCFSSAAVLTDTDLQLIREPTSGNLAWPSAVFADDGRLLVGGPAVARRNRDPASYRGELKRYLGQDQAIVLGGRRYAPQDLVTAVLGALKSEAENTAGEPISRAVLTVPASYGRADLRRKLMIAAAEATGLRTVELLAEPVAAVFAPVIGPRPQGSQLVLVYDFGGGTFDTALVRTGGDRDEVLGSAALDDCGGLDLDALLVSRLTDDASEWLTPLNSAAQAGGASTSLRLKATFGDVARSLKHQLSDATQAEEFVLPDSPSARLSRPDLALIAAPLLDRTVECCTGLLKQLDVPAADLSGVVMVGGSTRMPAVAETLSRAFGIEPRRADDPDLAVVRGAAQWARSNAVRSVLPLPRPPGSTLLRWVIPSARLLRWLVRPGASYAEGTPLARVRYDDGTIWDLCASRPGRLEQVFVDSGDELTGGPWLALAHEEES